MSVYKLTELQYSDDRKFPLRLYCYAPDGFHRGGIWFDRVPKYPEDGEITVEQAHKLADQHLTSGSELRITNSGDFLVFHAQGRVVTYPPEGAEKFWESLK